VLDLGAGVCPLPLALASNGFKVTTIDSHPKQRQLADKQEWNEWGFLDYSLFNKAICSYNMDFLKYRSKKKFDFIYSISVIEHIPKKSRLKILKNASRLLKKGGKLLLTIDLYPGSNDFWNLSEDKEVEPIKEHGTINTFKEELKKFGFRIQEENIQRNIYESRTDVYYISAQLERKSLFQFFS
jgi:2-polyprenyl-3-methyl-5-hydroxy-6-metoxy-1,4-benzoquinol methylase